ncbi:MAG: TRAP transporter permease, partial [Acidilobaceae archaeon]
ILGALYHLYIVIHPYTPLSYMYRIGVLDLTQLQRATHVFFILAIGYLLAFIERRHSLSLGLRWSFALALVILSFAPTYLSAAFVADKGYTWLAAYIIIVWVATILIPTLTPMVKVLDPISRYACLVLAVLAVLPYVYQVWEYEELIYRAVVPTAYDVTMGWTMTLLLFGIVLRFVGPEMPILVSAFILYDIYGYLFPRPWFHPGFDIDTLVGKIYSETEAALFGLITNVSFKYIAYFTMLAGLLSALGFSDLMAKAFFTLMGRSSASVGRVSVGMGVGMGMISGSGAADTAFIGSTLRDIFRAAGYPSLVAAGISANAGTLALITPPILGAIAFIMIEILNIPYTWIVVMALPPMLLYAASILVYNELYARAHGLKPVDAAPEKRFKPEYLLPFVLPAMILVMIFLGYTVRTAVVTAILVSPFLALLSRETRWRIKDIPMGLVEGMRVLVPVGASITIANVIMAMVVVSGLHQKFSLALFNMLGGNLILAILFAFTFSLILGMGVPPTATYVLASLLTAPVIIKMAVAIGIPEQAATLATHMFLFYTAMLADVTPPVALSAFAAASVFKENPIMVGIKAASVALPKYIYAISFIWSYWGTSILIMPVVLVEGVSTGLTLASSRIIAALIGTIFVAIANVGYFSSQRLTMPMRIMTLIIGVLLILPVGALNVAALIAGIAALLLVQKRILR